MPPLGVKSKVKVNDLQPAQEHEPNTAKHTRNRVMAAISKEGYTTPAATTLQPRFGFPFGLPSWDGGGAGDGRLDDKGKDIDRDEDPKVRLRPEEGVLDWPPCLFLFTAAIYLFLSQLIRMTSRLTWVLNAESLEGHLLGPDTDSPTNEPDYGAQSQEEQGR
ncbi:uncharacterized protein BJX67DRAFT_376419 [Aspergillus lucknowensis]|uniref:Uncharacterized protein n=1 Tax=Aspergillus lucknowensis TaxID=176173 RepID=A0ABR4M7U4_9EURO